MRITRLALQKYGVYLSRQVELENGAGLVIAYGPNEAGKSTWLEAVSDFLFGIPAQTARGSVYGYEGMTIAATLLGRDGSRVALTRRKGNRNTLLDGQRAVLESNPLTAWLGGLDRARFRSLFGLDHSALRRGGEELLSAKGDVGQLILEAGGGLRSLLQAIEELRREAGTLYGRNSETHVKRCGEALKRVEQVSKELRLTHRDYEQLRSECDAARAELEALRERHKRVLMDLSKRQRLVRVHPLLVEIGRLETILEGSAHLSALRPSFASEVRRALEERVEAEKRVAEARELFAILEGEIAELRCEPDVVEQEASIREAEELAKQVADDRSQRVKRETLLVERRAALSGLRSATGLGPDEDLGACMPLASMLRRVSGLARDGAALLAQRNRLIERARECTEEVDTLRIRVDQLSGAREPLRIDIGALASLPKDDAKVSEAIAQSERSASALQRDLANLGFADGASLRGFSCPDEATMLREVEDREGLRRACERLVQEREQQVIRHQTALATIARLEAGGPIPTEAAIERARRERETAWHPIRMAYLGEPAAISIPAQERVQVVATLKTRVIEADTLADRKSVEAKRIAELELALKERDESAIAMKGADATLERLSSELRDLEERWKARFPEAVAREPDLARLRLLVAARRELLLRAERAEQEEKEATKQRAALSPVLELLREAESLVGVEPGPDDTLTSRVRRVRSAVEEHKSLHDELVRAKPELAKREERARSAEKEKSESEEAVAAWRNAWAKAMRDLRLEEDAGIEEAQDVARQWSEAVGVTEIIAETERVLASAEARERRLCELVDVARGAVPEPLAADPVAAAKMLVERLDKARHEETRRRTLESQHKTRQAELQRYDASLEKAQRAVDLLCNEVVCPKDELATLAERHEEHLAHTARLTQQRESAVSAGDGVFLAELREQWAGQDIDALRANETDLEEEQKSLSKQIEEGAVRLRDKDDVLSRHEADESAACLAAEREAIVSELHLHVERYLEIELACSMLEQALEKVRSAHESPLIGRASQLFSRVTRSAFAGLETSVDDDGEPIVVGVRHDGTPICVKHMSEGTRDQLFLAFRVAYIEDYCKKTEPLPFVADDLLVHFDDQRSAATLELLAELGRVTQVILFTHHQAVVEAAQPLIREGGATLVHIAPDGEALQLVGE